MFDVLLASFHLATLCLHNRELDDVCDLRSRPTLEHLSSLHCLRAVTHEATRVAAITPVGVPHMATRDTKVATVACSAELRNML